MSLKGYFPTVVSFNFRKVANCKFAAQVNYDEALKKAGVTSIRTVVKPESTKSIIYRLVGWRYGP